MQYEYTVAEFETCSSCQMSRRNRITRCGEPENRSSQMHFSLEVSRTLLVKISFYLKIYGKLKVATKYDCCAFYPLYKRSTSFPWTIG